MKTAEEIATEADARIDALVSAIAKIKAEVARRGLGKGKGGHGGMPCTVPGCRGRIAFIVYTFNGHVMASCNVKGCVNLRE